MPQMMPEEDNGTIQNASSLLPSGISMASGTSVSTDPEETTRVVMYIGEGVT